MSFGDLRDILECADGIKNTVAFIMQQEEDPSSISISGHLHIINDKVKRCVEVHFNKGLPYEVYRVHEITMTSSPQRTSFVTKLTANTLNVKTICCNLSMNSNGELQIENIYHLDGSPVEGFTKG